MAYRPVRRDCRLGRAIGGVLTDGLVHVSLANILRPGKSPGIGIGIDHKTSHLVDGVDAVLTTP